MNVIVYGASDDLIEVEGDIREEFSPERDDEPTYLAFSNGTVLSVVYDRHGKWRIHPVAGNENVSIEFAPENEDDGYSDIATVNGYVTWAVCGHGMALNRR